MTWFSVRSVVEHAAKGGYAYEERVVIFDALDSDEAFRMAKAEAAEYCADLTDRTPADLYQLYEPFAERMESGAEVYSLIRTSRLPPKKYLDRFFDTGDELSGGS